MEILMLVIAVLCLIISFIGCFAPVIPGPPVALVSLILIKFAYNNVSWLWICIFTAAVLAVTLADYFVQAWGTKTLGGSKSGIIGAFLGMAAGFFFMPLGIILFPLIGAFAGEMIAGASAKQSFKSAAGTFIGFLAGLGLKLILCAWITVYFVLSFI
ncbi:MAG: DUF456 domain-containing protein [Endomicrobium sp.]|jgi:uncharacterized protein YqgC (DUF456 family)|nr:DUF456 domain-containing protein [Endomicrobium sp.]